jgi:hypothetical protein
MASNLRNRLGRAPSTASTCSPPRPGRRRQSEGLRRDRSLSACPNPAPSACPNPAPSARPNPAPSAWPNPAPSAWPNPAPSARRPASPRRSRQVRLARHHEQTLDELRLFVVEVVERQAEVNTGT